LLWPAISRLKDLHFKHTTFIYYLVIRFIGLLKFVTTINYSTVANSHTTIHCSTHWVFSVCCVFTGSLATAPDTADSSASVSTAQVLADWRLSHTNSSWPQPWRFSPSRVWPPLPADGLSPNSELT
jgi:hypothetical protein